MRAKSSVGIVPGDVIDLEDADVTFSKMKNEENLRIVLRTELRNAFITLFAGKESIGLHRAKVVSIDEVYMTCKKYNSLTNKQFVNVYVTLEETDEIPTLYAENSNGHTTFADEGVEWKRPEFRKE